MAPELENNILRSSSTTEGLQIQVKSALATCDVLVYKVTVLVLTHSGTYGMLERCRVEEGGKMLE